MIISGKKPVAILTADNARLLYKALEDAYGSGKSRAFFQVMQDRGALDAVNLLIELIFASEHQDGD